MSTPSKKNIYDLLSKDYKNSLMRSFLERKIIKQNYDKNYIGIKNSKNNQEDVVKIYDFNEINYKDKILELLKRSAMIKNIEDEFPNLRIMAKYTKLKDLDNYMKLKTNEFGEKILIIGSLIEDKYNNNSFGYCLSSEDKIKGRVLEIPLQQLPQEDIQKENEPKTSPICEGTILECNCGTAPTSLKVKSQNIFTVKQKLIATEKDNIPNTNISPFGSCKNIKFYPPCPLAITGKWENTSEMFKVNEGAVLLDNSSMKCSLGGEIKPKNGVGYWKSK